MCLPVIIFKLNGNLMCKRTKTSQLSRTYPHNMLCVLRTLPSLGLELGAIPVEDMCIADCTITTITL